MFKTKIARAVHETSPPSRIAQAVAAEHVVQEAGAAAAIDITRIEG